MSVAQVRGGIPRVRRLTVLTSGQEVTLPFFTSYLILRVPSTAGNPCRLFFTEADFNDDENYVEVAVAAAEYTAGEWQGPVEADNVWVKGGGGTSTGVELVVFQRRG